MFNVFGRIPALVLLLSLGALTTGCPPGEGRLDLTSVSGANFEEAYSAQLSVVRVKGDGSLDAYSGPARFTLSGGDLPPGITMNEAGTLAGTPTWVGSYPVEVWVSDLKNIESFIAPVTIDVSGANVNAFLGHERDQLTQLYYNQGGKQSDMWTRAAGGGEEGMESYTMLPGIYSPGPNGIAEEGLNDDVKIGDVARADVQVNTGPWEEVEEVDPFELGGGYPSGHYNEGQPVVYDDEWTFTAGSDTGQMAVTVIHPTYGMDETKIMVVPPDWCPLGKQIGNYWDDPDAACL